MDRQFKFRLRQLDFAKLTVRPCDMLILWAGLELNDVTKHVETCLCKQWESGLVAHTIEPFKIRCIILRMLNC